MVVSDDADEDEESISSNSFEGGMKASVLANRSWDWESSSVEDSTYVTDWHDGFTGDFFRSVRFSFGVDGADLSESSSQSDGESLSSVSLSMMVDRLGDIDLIGEIDFFRFVRRVGFADLPPENLLGARANASGISMAGFGVVGLVLFVRPLALSMALYNVEFSATDGFSFAAGLVSTSVLASIVIESGIWGCTSPVVGISFVVRFVSGLGSVAVVVLLCRIVMVGVIFAAGLDSSAVVVLWILISLVDCFAVGSGSSSVVDLLLVGNTLLLAVMV